MPVWRRVHSSSSRPPVPDPWCWRPESPGLRRGRAPLERCAHCAASFRSGLVICRQSPFSIVILDNAENLRRHLLHRQITVDRHEPPRLPVIVSHRLRLYLKCVQTRPDHFFAVIIADDKLGAVDVAKLVDSRWLKMDVIDQSAGGTRTTSGKPAQDL